MPSPIAAASTMPSSAKTPGAAATPALLRHHSPCLPSHPCSRSGLIVVRFGGSRLKPPFSSTTPLSPALPVLIQSSPAVSARKSAAMLAAPPWIIDAPGVVVPWLFVKSRPHSGSLTRIWVLEEGACRNPMLPPQRNCKEGESQPALLMSRTKLNHEPSRAWLSPSSQPSGQTVVLSRYMNQADFQSQAVGFGRWGNSSQEDGPTRLSTSKRRRGEESSSHNNDSTELK